MHPSTGSRPWERSRSTRSAICQTACPTGRLADLDLRDLLVAQGVERVIVTAEDLPDEAMMDLVRNCGAVSVKVSLVPDTSMPSAPRWRSTTSRASRSSASTPSCSRAPRGSSGCSTSPARRLGCCWPGTGRGARDRDQARFARPGAVPPATDRARRQRVHGVKFRSMVIDAEARTQEFARREQRSGLAEA